MSGASRRRTPGRLAAGWRSVRSGPAEWSRRRRAARKEQPVAGALEYSKYNPLKRWIMKRIAAKAGGGTDTSRDYDYTDWDDLQQFAEAFGRRVVASGAMVH